MPFCLIVRRGWSSFGALGRDLAITARVGGVEGVWQAVRYRTLNRLYLREKFLLLENPLSRRREPRSVPGVEVRVLEDADWGALEQAITTLNIRRFRARLERGRTCFVAWRGGRPIGYTWMSEQIDPEIEYHPIPLPSDAVLGWDLYVNRAERSRGVGSALVDARLAYARERGFRRSWRLIAPRNAPALRTAEKVGGEVRLLGELTFVRVLGRPVRSCQEIAP